MAWRVYSVSSADWSSKVLVSPESMPWTRALNTGSGGEAIFYCDDPEVAETVNETTMAPWKRILVMEYFGIVIYAGFIIDTDYDHTDRVLRVAHEDVWSVLIRRIMAGLVADGVQATQLVYPNTTLKTLAKQAVFQGQNDAARFNLPIALPSDVGGGVNRTHKGYQLPTVSSILADLIDDEDGPDIDFAPRWFGDGQLEWEMRAGAVNTGLWEWDVTAEESTASGLKYKTDGTLMANRVVAVGEGSEKKMLLSVVDQSATSDFLPLDALVQHKEKGKAFELPSVARGYLAAHNKPTRQVSMDVLMDEDFSVNMLQLGGTVRWKVEKDPFLADGWRNSRLIEYSGDLTDKVHLEFQTG
jgi:hypothetical protein